MQEQFKEYCRNYDLENAQLLLQQNPNIDIHDNNEEAFCRSCQNGQIEITKWLHSLGADIHTKNEGAFRLSCEYDHIEIAKWLYSLGANIHAMNEYAFRWSCQNGHIEIAKWLHSLGVDIHAENEFAFNCCCLNGHIEIAKWLYQLGANIHVGNEYAFRLSCQNGHIEVAKWLHRTSLCDVNTIITCEARNDSIGVINHFAKQNDCFVSLRSACGESHTPHNATHCETERSSVDIHAQNEYAFHLSCENGHIEVAKWLHSLGVDIHAMNEYAFRSSCQNLHIEIVKWLYEIGVIITNDMFNKNYTYEVKKLLVKYSPCAIYARSALYNELIKNYPEDEVKAQFRTKMNEYDIEEYEFDYALKFNECAIEINAEQNEIAHSAIKAKYQELITYFQIVY